MPALNRNITRHPVHAIYRLHSSLPFSLVKELRLKYQYASERVKAKHGFSDSRNNGITPEYVEEHNALQELYQRKYVDLLQRCKEGPTYLKSDEAKKIVIDSWLFLEQDSLLDIDAISVMDNHVHILFSHAEEYGVVDFKSLFERHKHFTATKINKILNRKGERFWARHVFDRDIRGHSFPTVFWYVINNPVRAGLTKDPWNWVGNYTAERLR